MQNVVLVFNRTGRDAANIIEVARFNVKKLPKSFIYNGWAYEATKEKVEGMFVAKLRGSFVRKEEELPELFADNKVRVEFRNEKDTKITLPENIMQMLELA